MYTGVHTNSQSGPNKFKFKFTFNFQVPDDISMSPSKIAKYNVTCIPRPGLYIRDDSAMRIIHNK